MYGKQSRGLGDKILSCKIQKKIIFKTEVVKQLNN